METQQKCLVIVLMSIKLAFLEPFDCSKMCSSMRQVILGYKNVSLFTKITYCTCFSVMCIQNQFCKFIKIQSPYKELH